MNQFIGRQKELEFLKISATSPVVPVYTKTSLTV